MNDSQIIKLYWDRDEQAIPVTSQKYGSYCTTIAKNILGNMEDAEECVNDTYLSAWNSLPPHKPSILSAFLGKITRNLSINRFRQNEAQKRGGGELPVVLDEIEDIVSCDETIEETMDRRELIQAIDSFLSVLSPEKRNIFICRYWYTDRISDIAARFGMSESAVSTSLSRIRSSLRTFLLERGFEL